MPRFTGSATSTTVGERSRNVVENTVSYKVCRSVPSSRKDAVEGLHPKKLGPRFPTWAEDTLHGRQILLLLRRPGERSRNVIQKHEAFENVHPSGSRLNRSGVMAAGSQKNSLDSIRGQTDNWPDVRGLIFGPATPAIPKPFQNADRWHCSEPQQRDTSGRPAGAAVVKPKKEGLC